MNVSRSRFGATRQHVGSFDPTAWIELTKQGIDTTVKTVQAGKAIADATKKKKKAKKKAAAPVEVYTAPPTSTPGWLVPAAISAVGLVAFLLLHRPAPAFAPAQAPARANPRRRRRRRAA